MNFCRLNRIDKYNGVLYIQFMNDVQEMINQLSEKGWTISAIAEEAGTHRETVSRWDSGKYYPENSKAVLMLLDGLLERKRVPKKRRYNGRHHLQRKKAEQAE